MTYRSEVDNLRAVAVISVIFFHYFPNILPLGYLGVDIFFVISGFLISKIIFEEYALNTFTFKGFYVRRAKRIIPATLICLALTSFGAFFILINTDFTKYAESLAATILMFPNFYFWRDGGYFGSADELKPLLHLWSLGVEIQFYTLFPIVFVLLLKFTKSIKILIPSIMLVFLLSFTILIFLERLGGENPAFFLLPTRIWEFALGILAAIIFMKKSIYVNKKISTLLLVSISLTIIIFQNREIAISVLVTLFTSIILSLRYQNGNKNFVSSSFVTYIGKISFSLYLYHWPIATFIRYIYVDEVEYYVMCIGIICTFVFAVLSYHFIENPFRSSKDDKKTILLISLTVILSLLSISTMKLGGLDFGSKKELSSIIARASQTHFRCKINSYFNFNGRRACLLNQADDANLTVLYGNSHAQMYAPVLKNYLIKNRISGFLIPMNGCLPTIRLNLNKRCMEKAKLNLDALSRDKNISNVIIATTWYRDKYYSSDGFIIDPNQSRFASELIHLKNELEKNNKRVFLIGPLLIPGENLASRLGRQLKFSAISEQEALKSLKKESSLFNNIFEGTLKNLFIELENNLLLPHNYFCDLNHCYFGDRSNMYFSDSNHLSLQGRKKVMNLFDDIPLK